MTLHMPPFDASIAPDPFDAVPIPLGQFLRRAGEAILGNLPSRVLIEATVVAVKAGPYGHTLELVDAEKPTDKGAAGLRAFLGAAERRAISIKFGFPFDPAALVGRTATLLIAPQFHARYHLQGKILGLAQSMQASLLAAAIDEIRRKLKAEGLYDRQRRLPMPLDITRVVVIHPANAASWADVSTQLMSWQQAGILTVESLPAAFEGPRASQELVGALMQARTPDASGQRPDLIVLVRGGGARSGLLSLDNEAVARTICTSPIPVLTGLGHASDHSLLEDVAAFRADTPSKSAGSIGDADRLWVAGQTGAAESRNDRHCGDSYLGVCQPILGCTSRRSPRVGRAPPPCCRPSAQRDLLGRASRVGRRSRALRPAW